MSVVEQIQLDAAVNSVGANAAGDRIAVAVGDREAFLYRVSGGRLTLEKSFLLPRGQHEQTRFRETHVALTDEHTLLVARTATRHEPYKTWVELLAVDLRTNQQRGVFRTVSLDGLRVTGLAPCSPGRVLLGVFKTVLCIDTTSFTEVCRARVIDAVGDVTEPDADPEEKLAPNGFVFDPGTRLLHFLCGRFNEAILLRYRLEDACFVQESRQVVMQGHDPAGICLNPSGDGATISLQVMDAVIDLEGREVANLLQEHERMLGLSHEPLPPAPRSARLGCLYIMSDAKQQRIDVHAELERDFLWGPHETLGPTGQMVIVGYRFSAGLMEDGAYMTTPVYLDDRRLVVGTPSGMLLCFDTASERSELLHDFQSPINSLVFAPRDGLLLVGCADGGLSVLST